MNQSTDIEKYAANMKEIRLRTEVITAYLSGQQHARYIATTIETIGLQFRKTFELLAFASLAANRKEYSSAYADFAKHWEAAKLLRNLKRINPDFYPKPVIEVPADRPGVVNALKDREQDYLTQADLIEAHGRCGVLLHSANPFGRQIDYGFYQRSFPTWITKIIKLLNNHKVHLLGDTNGFYLFHMKETGNEEVRWYRFERTKTPLAPR